MRESFLNVMRGERGDEIVWTADLTYWVSGQMQAGRGRPEWNTERGHLELCRDLGCMPYYWYEKLIVASPRYDGITERTEVSGQRRIHSWETPVGRLVQEITALPEASSEAITKYPVATEADLKVFLHILQHRQWVPCHLDTYRERMDRWAAFDGLPAVCPPRSPLPGFFCEWAGVQHGVYLLMDYPDLVREALALMEAQEKPVLDAIARTPPPVVHFPDNLSSDNFASLFDEFMAEPYRRRLDRLHAAGIRCAVHLDGTVRGLLPKLAAVGFDAVEALTPKPVGDVGLHEMRAVAGRADVVLWGGVPGAMFAPPFTWKDMEKHVGQLLEQWGGTPFVVGVADQVPPDGDIEFVRGISAMIRGRRP